MSDIEREAFEREFPVPKYVEWCGNGYAPTKYSADQGYNRMWKVWQAARQAPEPVALDDAMTDDFKAAWKNGLPLSSAEAKWAFVGWQARSEAPASGEGEVEPVAYDGGDLAAMAEDRREKERMRYVPERLLELAYEELSDAAAEAQEGGEYCLPEWVKIVTSSDWSTHPPAKVPDVTEFGKGELVVSRGTYGQKPAVFVSPVQNGPGVVGEHPGDREPNCDPRLRSGEWVMTFPAHEQAGWVCEALWNRLTTPTPATTPKPEVNPETVYWYFEGSEQDSLETLHNDVQVVLSAGTLKGLLDGSPNHRSSEQ